jgi:hypothetical protein
MGENGKMGIEVGIGHKMELTFLSVFGAAYLSHLCSRFSFHFTLHNNLSKIVILLFFAFETNHFRLFFIVSFILALFIAGK